MTMSPHTGLVVTAPERCGEEVVATFVRRHTRWVLRQVERQARVVSRISKRWPYGPTLPYLGEECRVVVQEAAGRSAVYGMPDRALLIQMRQPNIDGARRLLKRWYRAQALHRLQERVAVLGAQMGIGWRRIRIGDQRTRWGSCSATGALSFNFRLVMMPLPVLEYVIVHELCHRRYLCHHPHFWRALARHQPDYRASIAWLREHGPWLW